ncbi:MAG: hypothetical protein GY861_22405 [bacterium]|nr:hypothetical protein [bacterium]
MNKFISSMVVVAFSLLTLESVAAADEATLLDVDIKEKVFIKDTYDRGAFQFMLENNVFKGDEGVILSLIKHDENSPSAQKLSVSAGYRRDSVYDIDMTVFDLEIVAMRIRYTSPDSRTSPYYGPGLILLFSYDDYRLRNLRRYGAGLLGTFGVQHMLTDDIAVIGEQQVQVYYKMDSEDEESELRVAPKVYIGMAYYF